MKNEKNKQTKKKRNNNNTNQIHLYNNQIHNKYIIIIFMHVTDDLRCISI